MRSLFRAELLKLRTTRMFYGYTLAALAFVPLSLTIAIQTAGEPGGAPALSTSEGVRNVMSSAWSGSSIVLIIGILVIAGEFRHNTATSTFLVSPDRKQVVIAKLLASSLIGGLIAVVASALTLAIALPWLAAKDIHASVLSADVGLVLLGVLAAASLYALIGVGVGSMIRNQTTAIVVALVWGAVVEALLVSFAPEVGRWLPGGAASALTGASTTNGGLLPMWGGAMLLAAYGLALAATAIRFTLQRDVT